MTNEERIERFRNGKIAVNCETEEEAKSFIKWCFDNGMCWKSGTEDEIFFDMYKNKTCYSFDYFTGDECLGYDSESFHKREGYEVITYKDFMKERKMTNLEYVTSKGLVEDGNTLCYTARVCKHGVSCEEKEYNCSECEFNNDIDLCIKTLLEEHREPIKIKLTQWEYDLIMIEIDKYGYSANAFSWIGVLEGLKEKGYFKGVYDTSMTLREILDNCEIVADDYDFGE